MKPSVGRVVIYREGDGEAPARHLEPSKWAGTNGTREHPAIITRVWSDTCVNLHVFFDANLPEARCSVVELPDLPEGVVMAAPFSAGWRWPART